jgi:hypothetical protein
VAIHLPSGLACTHTHTHTHTQGNLHVPFAVEVGVRASAAHMSFRITTPLEKRPDVLRAVMDTEVCVCVCVCGSEMVRGRGTNQPATIANIQYSAIKNSKYDIIGNQQ